MYDQTVLEVDAVSKHFGGVRAVNDASMYVHRGRIVSLIGPNGAGKTTLFNTVTGVLPVTAGKIHFRAEDGRTHRLTGRRPDQITRLGVARTFQNIRLFANLTVLENVKIGLHGQTHSGLVRSVLRTPGNRREERRITDASLDYLQFVGLSHRVGDEATSLSYGEQRAVEIARALATHPTLLLLDEPAAGLNPSETTTLMALIRRIRDRGITIFLIEHDMRMVMEISDHVYVLDHGEIICKGPSDVVKCDPRVVEAYLGQPAAEAG